MAIVLAGGGITGGVYEVGALRALDDFLVSHRVTDFDIFVGTSAGSLVASLLANGVSPDQLFRGIVGTDKEPVKFRTLKRFDIYAPAWSEYRTRLTQFPKVIFRVLSDMVRGPEGMGVIDSLMSLGEAFPSGILDNRPLEQYVKRALSVKGLSDDFDKLKRQLFIPAVNLDTARRTVFGAPEAPRVPISKAVRASSAIPMLFCPVKIADGEYVDGGVEKNLHLDVAIEQGAKLIVAVNPIVPFLNSPEEQAGQRIGNLRHHISTRGLAWVADQVYRTLIYTRMELGLARIRRIHPDVDIILLEPRRDDARMFLYNVMRYNARVSIAKHGFLTVHKTLGQNFARYRQVFASHGLEISRALIDREYESLAARRFSMDAVVQMLSSVPFVRRMVPSAPSALPAVLKSDTLPGSDRQ